MKICHINLARGYRGGERQTELLVRELARRGIEQRVVGRAAQPLTARLAGVHGVEVVELRKPFALGLAQLSGDIVHAHEARGAKMAYLRWRMAGTPYLMTRRIGKRPGDSWLTRTVYRQAAVHVGVADSVSRVIASYTGRQVHTVYSALSDLAVDAQRVRALRERWKNAFVVLNVAALVDSQKGQSHLIEVARRAAHERPEMYFVLAGEGRDRKRFERQASGLPNLEFAGFVNNVGDYLAAADCFVLPSRHEGIGGACLDAMRAGLPVVASAVDGLPEFISDAENGRLVAPGDESSLFAALCDYVDHPGARKAIAAAGRRTAAEFSVERMADGYQKLYASIYGI